MGKGYRQGRLGEEIRKIISELLLREIKDPRLSGMVSISAVEVTADGSYATAYVSVLGLTSSSEASEEEKEEVLAAFRSAKGLIKREIENRSSSDMFRRCYLKWTPLWSMGGTLQG